MFISISQIEKSIEELGKFHPFFGITFLTCKKARLPIGRKVDFFLDAKTKEFMEQHHHIAPDSEYYFQPYKSVKKWVRSDYPSSGLQAINTRTFPDAFLHDRGISEWGWSDSYVNVLKARLTKKQKKPILISIFDMAIWIYKYRDWPEDTKPEDLVKQFTDDFHITSEEIQNLFTTSIPNSIRKQSLFSERSATWSELRVFITSPPDAKPEQGGTLRFLQTEGVGPANVLTLEPSERLTLITGDNGLGKTFLLECAWWALTGSWAEIPVTPPLSKQGEKAEISFSIQGEYAASEEYTSISFDWKSLSWPDPEIRPTIPGLIVYARVDGSFAVWDPAEFVTKSKTKIGINRVPVYTSAQVWDGDTGHIEGLIRDWVRWQTNKEKHPFEVLETVLECLSPPDLGRLSPGEPIRMPGDKREIPTIKHPYGEIPIFHASAGVRRIITFAYLIVWAWNEHKIVARQRGVEPERRMVILVDEIEAHLHPRWQRSILPALMRIGELLSEELNTQFLVATHSPLVMASAEAVFDESNDSLVHLNLDEQTGKVSLKEIDFNLYGDVSSWLTSPVFELRHARSGEAEKAIIAAKKLQEQERPLSAEVRQVSSQLVKYLAPDDMFWPRWISFAEKHGVEL